MDDFYTWILFLSAVLATYGSQTSRKWQASKGFNKISEIDFLSIAEYKEEASIVKQYRASNNLLFVYNIRITI